MTKQDSVILGPGGSNSWRSSLRGHCAEVRTHAKDARVHMDFYLGTHHHQLSCKELKAEGF